MSRPLVHAFLLLLLAAWPRARARADDVLDLNAATAEAFEQLPGIGPSKARAIVKDRDEHGPFSSVEALDRVKGFGVATVSRLKPHLRVGAAPAPAAPGTLPAAPDLDALDRESPEGKLNLNVATLDQLQQLDGILRANARIIVAWRQKRGPFRHICELAKVPGLPPRLLQTVQYFVTVRFDANTVRGQELEASGLARSAAEALLAARGKHGNFEAAADLEKVAGLSAEERAALRALLWFP